MPPRPLTQQERATLWLYNERYAAQREGAIEFYKTLHPAERRLVQDMLDDLCPKKTGPLMPRARGDRRGT